MKNGPTEGSGGERDKPVEATVDKVLEQRRKEVAAAKRYEQLLLYQTLFFGCISAVYFYLIFGQGGITLDEPVSAAAARLVVLTALALAPLNLFLTSVVELSKSLWHRMDLWA